MSMRFSTCSVVATAITDENGFYYFLDIEAGFYYLSVDYSEVSYSLEAIAEDKELTSIDFVIP